MLCKNPYMLVGKYSNNLSASIPCPCGQCMPCRINRRRVWTLRILLESFLHSCNCFLTLTYAPEHIPAGGTLVPRDVQLFLKRLRKVVAPATLRYFFVGEYGDDTERPHYHAALFGISPLSTHIVQEAWGLGHVMLGDLTPQSARYVAGYVTKKMTSKLDSRLNGRHPEFSRMSLRPGIGAGAVDRIVEALGSNLNDRGDVPATLHVHGKMMPMGRYILGKLRERVSTSKKASFEEQVQYLLDVAKKDFEDGREVDILDCFMPGYKGKVALAESQHDVYSRKGVL